MGNLEKYGVLALIFVIVLILTVAIWNGPAPPKPTEVAKADPPPPARTENPPAPAAGPTNAPAPTPAPNAPQSPVLVDSRPQFRTYTVEKNDNLASIAKKMLGSSARWTEIAKANEGLDPKKLRIGQAILVPFSDEETKSDASPEIKEAPKAAKGRAKSQKLASR